MSVYKYSEIQNAYRNALLKASDRIGLDSSKKKFFKEKESIDLEIIHTEIQNMIKAGSDIGEICVGKNVIDNIINNIKLIVSPKYKQRTDNIREYSQGITLEPVHLYSGKIMDPMYESLVPLNPDMVLNDLYNAFHHGLVSSCNDKPKFVSEIYSKERVVKK